MSPGEYMNKKWPDVLTGIATSLIISFTMFRAGNSYAESVAFKNKLDSKADKAVVIKIQEALNIKVDADFVSEAIKTSSDNQAKVADIRFEFLIRMISDTQRNQITNTKDIKDILKMN